MMDRKLPSRYFGCDRKEIKKHRKKINKLIKKIKIRK